MSIIRRSLWTGATAAALLPACVLAQDASDAERALEAGRLEEAASIYRQLVAADPDDARRAFQYAYALHQAGAYEGAIELFTVAAASERFRAPALYNVACGQALLGRVDAGLGSLAGAVEAGFDGLDLLRSDSDLDALRADPRFGEIVDGLRRTMETTPYPPLTFDSIDERMKAEEADGFSGVLLVVRGGEVVHHGAYGMANRERGIPVGPDTIFAIGSTPIDFTKAGILLLDQRGKLDLDDPITTFFDDVPEDKRSITIRHLMTGASGLHDFHDLPTDRDPDHSWIDRDEAMRRIFAKALLFEPGTGDVHSHSAWGVLAAIVEIVSGRSYPAFVKAELLEPAGMSSTFFFGEAYPEDRMAVGYGDLKDGQINAPPYWGRTSWLVMGSGGQASTAMDLYRWNQAMRHGDILDEAHREMYFLAPGNVMEGGDQYGYQVYYTEGPETMFFLLTNVRRRANQRLARDVIDLVFSEMRR